MTHVPAAERRPQLIRAAIDYMAREGVAAGSTRAIAAELGVAHATVHYTFGTKEGLYRAVGGETVQLGSGGGGADPRDVRPRRDDHTAPADQVESHHEWDGVAAYRAGVPVSGSVARRTGVDGRA